MNSRRSILLAFLSVASVLILWAAWRGGTRYYVLYRISRIPGARERAAIMPKELDLADTRATSATVYNLGYARFSLPVDSPVELTRSSGEGATAIVGKSPALSFAFFIPFHPLAPSPLLSIVQSQARKLPEAHAMRRLVEDQDLNSVDCLIQIERTAPIPFSRVFFMKKDDFTLYAFQLIEKSLHRWGRGGIYTFATPATKGLVHVGEEGVNMNSVHVMFQSLSGHHAVGLFAYPPKGKEGPVLDLLKPLLKTFRFTGDSIGTKDAIRAQIEGAGIPVSPQREEED